MCVCVGTSLMREGEEAGVDECEKIERKIVNSFVSGGKIAEGKLRRGRK